MDELKAMTQSDESAFHLDKVWLKAISIWLIVVAGLFAVFWPTLAGMVNIWWTSSTFNHCFLILPIVGFLVWERRDVFSVLQPRHSYLGLAIILLGSVGWLLGAVADAQVIQQFSLVFILQGSIVAIFGKSVARALVFPLFFLLFAVPFGEFLVPGLQNITAHITIWLLKASGLPVFSDGVFISVPNGDFHVAEACSGVRFLIATVPLGVLFANVSFVSWRRRSIVIFLSFLIPIIANGMRAYGIIMIAYFTNNQYALGVDHLIYGWIFFAFVTLVFLSIGMIFVDRPNGAQVLDMASLSLNRQVTSSPSTIIYFAILVLLTANSGPIYAKFLEQDFGAGSAVALNAPLVGGKWRMAEPSSGQNMWKPLFKGVSSEVLQNYVREDGANVSLYIGYYSHQKKGADIMSFGNTVAAPEPWEWAASGNTSINLKGVEVPINAITIVARYDRRRVWYWYWVDNRFTNNPLVAKLLIAKSKLLSRHSEAAIIAVSMGNLALNERRSSVFEDFLHHIEPMPPFFPDGE